MKTTTINYQDQDHTAVMNLNTIRKYSKLKGFKTVNEFGKSFEGLNEEDLSFDQLDDLAALFLCAFQEGARIEKKQCSFILDDVFAMLHEARDQMMNMMADSIKGEDEEVEEGNPQKPGAKKKGS
jgi:hypothetical protein